MLFVQHVYWGCVFSIVADLVILCDKFKVTGFIVFPIHYYVGSGQTFPNILSVTFIYLFSGHTSLYLDVLVVCEISIQYFHGLLIPIPLLAGS